MAYDGIEELLIDSILDDSSLHAVATQQVDATGQQQQFQQH